MRPVIAKMVRLHELQDGTYDLNDIALLNDALDAEAENAWRAHESARKANQG